MTLDSPKMPKDSHLDNSLFTELNEEELESCQGGSKSAIVRDIWNDSLVVFLFP